MLAERVSAGDPVTDADAQILLDSRDLIAIGTMADEVRRRIHGARTTFVRVYEVHVDAPPASLPSTLAAGEIRIVGVPASIESAVAVVSAVRALSGPVPVTGFSVPTLSGLGPPVREVAERLHDAGLQAVAEVPVDAPVGPEMISEVRAGGLLALRLTVHGHGDVSSASVVRRALDLQNAVGGFRAFAPLPRLVSPVTPTTGYDDVKLVAMARVMAAGIPSIQVDWPLYGPKLAQVALTMGADDLDGIAAFEASLPGPRRTALAEVTGNIRAAALEPAERNGRFEPNP
jgi:aminodeoxyfutalosine synthase